MLEGGCNPYRAYTAYTNGRWDTIIDAAQDTTTGNATLQSTLNSALQQSTRQSKLQ